MTMSVDGQRTGLQGNPFEQLVDLDFADDLALISGTRTNIQCKTTRLHEHSKQLGLRINVGKTKVTRLNTKTHQPITIKEQNLEDVVEFVYLRSNISTDGGADRDVELRISKARHCKPFEHSDLYGSLPSSPETPKQNQNLQYKRKICPSLWL